MAKIPGLKQLLVESGKNNSLSNLSDKTLLTREAEIRGKLLAIEKRKIKRILEHSSGYENHMASLFAMLLLPAMTRILPSFQKQSGRISISTIY
jgi:hypothetical protein